MIRNDTVRYDVHGEGAPRPVSRAPRRARWNYCLQAVARLGLGSGIGLRGSTAYRAHGSGRLRRSLSAATEAFHSRVVIVVLVVALVSVVECFHRRGGGIGVGIGVGVSVDVGVGGSSRRFSRCGHIMFFIFSSNSRGGSGRMTRAGSGHDRTWPGSTETCANVVGKE